MNILVLNYEYPPIGGGGGIVSKYICEKAVENGHNVDVITMAFEKLPNEEEINGVKIHRVKCLRKSMRVCHPWEQLSYCIRAFKYIKKNVNIEKYDVIHSHFIIPTGLLALKIKRKYKKEYILTAHGSDVLGHNKSRFSILYKLIRPGWMKIVKEAKAITAPSKYLFEKIENIYSDKKIRLVPNGIDFVEYEVNKKEKSIVVLTRLQESKGVQDLLEAFSKIDNKGWIINVLGDGPYRQQLQEMVETKNLTDKVYFRGHTEGKEKMQYLSKAGLYFSGSRFEAFPISVLEATACQNNTLVNNIQPHKDLVGDEHVYSGIDELIHKLQIVVSEEPRKCVYNNEKYDWKNVYKIYEDLFQEVKE